MAPAAAAWSRRRPRAGRRRSERAVKPSAQPTLVRTQHLPHPGETARSLRKRGPAGRFLLVTICIRVCHCGSMHGTVHVHIADSVRAKLAVRITAPFADPCPFCPFIRAPGLIVWLVHAAHSCGPVLRRSTRAGRRAGLVRTCGGAGCRIGGAIPSTLPQRRRPSARRPPPGGRPARCRASDAAGGSGRCTSGGVHVARVPGVPSGTRSG